MDMRRETRLRGDKRYKLLHASHSGCWDGRGPQFRFDKGEIGDKFKFYESAT
jgi:hypothetical protein